MGKLTIKYMRPLGEYDQKFGQKYWGKVHEEAKDVSFNIMNPVNFEDGDGIEFEEKLVKETKPKYNPETGKEETKEYYQLRKVKRANSGSGEENHTQRTSSAPTTNVAPKPAAAPSELSYEAGTNARWALKLSVDTYKAVVGGMPDTQQNFDDIKKFASWLIKAFGELKSGPEPEPGKGLEMARAKADEIRGRNQPEDVTDEPGYEDPFEGSDE